MRPPQRLHASLGTTNMFLVILASLLLVSHGFTLPISHTTRTSSSSWRSNSQSNAPIVSTSCKMIPTTSTIATLPTTTTTTSYTRTVSVPQQSTLRTRTLESSLFASTPSSSFSMSSQNESHDHSNKLSSVKVLFRSLVRRVQWILTQWSSMFRRVLSIANKQQQNKIASRPSFSRQVSRFVAVAGLTLALQTAVLPPPPAFASSPEAPPATSLRPGMNKDQAQQLETGQVTREQLLQQQSSQQGLQAVPRTQDEPVTKVSNSVEEYYDLDDYDDLDDVKPKSSPDNSKSPFSASSPQKKKKKQPDALQGVQAKSQFATAARSESAGVTKLKVSLAVGIPTFGGTIVREQIRRRREANYVKKGLEIQKAQYAEYFNVTGTTQDDADVEDALKDLKNNTTKTKEDGDEEEDDDDDDDDDEDDDDDDEDEPPKARRQRPKLPKPGNGGGDDGGDNDSSGGNDSRPSDQDLDRLNDLFNKS